MAYVDAAAKVIVDGRKELANINRPVSIGVVLGNQRIPCGHRHRGSATDRVLISINISQRTGEGIGVLLTGRGDGVGEGGIPQQVEPDSPSVDLRDLGIRKAA